MRKKIAKDVMANLSAQFSSEWAQKKAVLKNELAMEKGCFEASKEESADQG